MNTKIFIDIISSDSNIISLLKRNAANCNLLINNIYDNGKDAVLQINSEPQKASILFIDMGSNSPDPLVITAICNKLFPTIKIIALDTTSGLPIHNAYKFILAGGKAYIGSAMLNANSMVYKVYNNNNMFATIIQNVLKDVEFYIDETLYNTTNHQLAIEQLQLSIQKKLGKFKFISKQEKLYLHLKVAGFNREEKGIVLDVSLSTVKQRAEKLKKDLGLPEIEDLILFAIQNGIVQIKNRIF